MNEHVGGAAFQYLGDELLSAAQVCALPHWLDDELAVELLETTGHNGTSSTMLQRVKRLPFVRPLGATGWCIDEEARTELVDDLRTTQHYLTLSRLLAQRFARQHDVLLDYGARDARIAQWRAAYHFADVAPHEAAARLVDLVDEATSGGMRVADVEAAIEVFDEYKSLAPYQAQRAYARGRLRYELRDFEGARADFEMVWNARDHHRSTHIAGHLMSAIDIKRDRADSSTVQRLRDAAQLAAEFDDQFSRALILNTLVSELLKDPARSDDPELLEMALESAATQNNSTGYATLGRVQLRRGNHEAADQSLERALSLSGGEADNRAVSVALNTWAWMAVKLAQFNRAMDILDRKIQFEISRRTAGQEYLESTTDYLVDLIPRVSQPPAAWVLVESSARRLAYAHGDRLVIVRRQPGDTQPLSLPESLRGRWLNVLSGEIEDFGATVDLVSALRGRMAAVFERHDDG